MRGFLASFMGRRVGLWLGLWCLILGTALSPAWGTSPAGSADLTLGLGQPRTSPFRPVSTYSIIAIDPEANEMGVAVQSHWFSVGSVVTWAEPGVGVVATQSLVDVSYGPLGLDLMRGGKTASEALQALLRADEGREVRQVAMLDVRGNVVAHTGSRCIPEAGHQVGPNYSVQANLMLRATVWPAMARAFETTKGDLAERLMAALEAAEAEGGDLRGRQSAAMKIVRVRPEGPWWRNVVMELRVEDHPAPLKELRRLIQLHRAYAHMNAGDAALEKNDMATAMREYAAAEALAPDNLEMRFWHAVGLIGVGRLDEALPILVPVLRKDARWMILLERLPKVGLLPPDPAILERVRAALKK